jgi:hypothetical protein
MRIRAEKRTLLGIRDGAKAGCQGERSSGRRECFLAGTAFIKVVFNMNG